MLIFNLRRNRAGMLILIILIATSMFMIFLQTFELNGDPRLTLIKLMAGTADRPFVYRVLAPTIIRLVSVATALPPAVVTLGVMWLSLISFALTFRSFARHFIAEPLLADLATIFALVGLYPSFYFGKIYDFTILFLFVLELLLMYTQRWWAYTLLFPIACLGKETTVLLGLVFALHFFRQLDRRTFFTLLAAQAIIFLVIRLTLTWVFRNNPGNTLEFHLFDHLRAFGRQPIFFSLWLLWLSGMVGIAWYRWQHKPLFLRQAALGIAGPLVILFFISGGPYELRALYEAYPVMFLLMVLSLDKKPDRLIKNPAVRT